MNKVCSVKNVSISLGYWTTLTLTQTNGNKKPWECLHGFDSVYLIINSISTLSKSGMMRIGAGRICISVRRPHRTPTPSPYPRRHEHRTDTDVTAACRKSSSATSDGPSACRSHANSLEEQLNYCNSTPRLFPTATHIYIVSPRSFCQNATLRTQFEVVLVCPNGAAKCLAAVGFKPSSP